MHTTGAFLVWLHETTKKVHLVIIQKGWLSQQEAVPTDAHMSKITISQAGASIPARCWRGLSQPTCHSRLHQHPDKVLIFLEEDLPIQEITRNQKERAILFS